LVYNQYLLLEDEKLLSDQPKFLLSFRYEFYHTIMDTLSVILWVNRVQPNTLFVIYTDTRYVDSYGLYEPVLDILKTLGIEYLVISDPVDSINKIDPILSISGVRNFSFLADHDIDQGLSLVDRKVAFDVIKGLSSRTTKAPYRRVYISRRGAGFVLSDDTYPGYKDDIRVHNEDRLEEFLLSIGFEIVHPEDFASFQEQIDLMAETSVLMAPTGSGLVNLGLLQNEQIVIELKCELLSLEPTDQRLINIYSDLSYVCGHTHIAISNMEKDADAVITRLRHLLPLDPTHII
jgi:hypothetical protein